MPPDLTPRTKLDFLYQEILGEVSELVGRLEVVTGEIREIAKARLGERAAEALERAAVDSAGKVRAALELTGERVKKELATAADRAVARVVASWGDARWGVYAIAAAVALVAGLVGGAVVVLARSAAGW